VSSALTTAVVGALVALTLVGIAGVILFAGGYQLKPKNVKLPFMEFDTSRFGDLSPVRLFANVSRVVIRPSKDAQNWLDQSKSEITPIILIHVGWQIVSNAYVREFLSYPTEGDIPTRIEKLGSQNAEFIGTFQKIYHSAIRFDNSLTLEFATEYFLRAPSLAVRISGSNSTDQAELFREIASLLPNQGGD